LEGVEGEMSRTVIVKCATCGAPTKKCPSEINRANALGRRFFCDKDCAGIARRTIDTRADAQKKADKREYDRVYRELNRARIKRLKAMRYQRDRDPEKERAKRQERMSYHVEYCRQYYADPKRKAEKVRYDAERRALLATGDPYWAECHLLLVALNKEIRARSTSYQRRVERGYYTRDAQRRRRDAQISRW
jgi:hypothetical protein